MPYEENPSLLAEVYVFLSRSSLIDEKLRSIIDDFLIRIMHIESMYDVLRRAGEIDIKKLAPEVQEQLLKRKEVIVKSHRATEILRLLNWNEQYMNVKYIILRLKTSECDS